MRVRHQAACLQISPAPEFFFAMSGLGHVLARTGPSPSHVTRCHEISVQPSNRTYFQPAIFKGLPLWPNARAVKTVLLHTRQTRKPSSDVKQMKSALADFSRAFRQPSK